LRNNRPISSFLIFLLFLSSFLIPHSLSASGKKDTSDQATLNDEWILCITAFDYSMLSPARRITGEVVTRNLVSRLNTVSYRFRIDPEYAYYEGYAWQQSLTAAAKALAQKQEERSRMLYRGDPDWRYRTNLKKINADIEKLQEEYLKKEAEKPLIHQEPTFRLMQANVSGTYPAPPKPGAERRFCLTQKVDAFLTGEVREFHGRYFVLLRLYTLYTNSYVYEDDIIFSMEDTDGAVDEIAARLTAVLAGNRPAGIAISASPPNTQILINQNYAGRGTVETRDHPPGTVTVAFAAEGFMPETVETELFPGELAEIDVFLVPMHFADVQIGVPGKTGAAVYQGALYVGQAPLTLRLPVEQLNYVVAETGRNEMGKAVFASPDIPDGMFDVSLKTKRYPPPGEKRVNKARSRYYWAWGSTWVAAIAAWVTNGIYASQYGALQYERYDDAFLQNTLRMYYISTGAVIVVGGVVVYKFIQLGRYLNTASEHVTPIVKQEKQRK